MKIILSSEIIFFLSIILVIAIVIGCRIISFLRKSNEKEVDKVHKFIEFYDIFVKWLQIKQSNKDFSVYFKYNEYKTVAIYGMKEMGQLLLAELRRAGVNVTYAIDKNANDVESDIEVVKPFDVLKKVDVIIVTAPHYFDDIYIELQKYTDAEIVSIEDLLWSI